MQTDYNLCLHLCFDQSLKIAIWGTKGEFPPIWYKKNFFQIMTLINLCNTICNQVNEEKFMFQIGSILNSHCINKCFSLNWFILCFFHFFVPSSNVNTTTCNSSNYFMISLLLQFSVTHGIDKNFLVIHNNKMNSFLLISSFMHNLWRMLKLDHTNLKKKLGKSKD